MTLIAVFAIKCHRQGTGTAGQILTDRAPPGLARFVPPDVVFTSFLQIVPCDRVAIVLESLGENGAAKRSHPGKDSMTQTEDEFFKELLAVFKEEADEHMQAILAGLEALEGGVPAEKEAEVLEPMYRGAHTLKGAARAVDLSVIEGPCVALQDLFRDWKNGELRVAAEQLGAVRSAVEMLGRLLAGEPVSDGDLARMVRSIDALAGRGPPEDAGGSSPEEVSQPLSPTKPLAPEETSILIVEDSPTARLILRNVLETAGYTVVVAKDGKEGWDLLGTVEVHAVVSDVDMPVMNGLQLVAEIRKDPRTSGLPVVLVTSRESEQDKAAGLAAGANVYLRKSSFDQNGLLTTLKGLLA